MPSPAVDVFTPVFSTMGIRPVVLLQQMAKLCSVAETRTEKIDCIVEQDQRNDTIMTYVWIASVLRCFLEDTGSIITAHLQNNLSSYPLRRAQAQPSALMRMNCHVGTTRSIQLKDY